MIVPTPNPMIAALWMIGSIVSFTSMAIAGRAVAFELDTFEIMMYRSFLGIVVVITVAKLAGTLHQVNRQSLHIHTIRNLSHFAGQNLWFYAITVAPLAQVFALEFTMPLWAMLLAFFVLGETLTRTRIIVALLGFVGILIITRPWVAGIGPGILPAALAAFGFAGSAIFTRLLTRTQTITCILFWLTVLQAGFGIIFAGFDGDVTLPSAVTLPWLALIGTAGLFAHFCLTKALSLAPATFVIPIDFIRLPLVAVVAMLIYGEALDPAVLIGAAIIFAANYLNIWTEARARRKPAQA